MNGFLSFHQLNLDERINNLMKKHNLWIGSLAMLLTTMLTVQIIALAGPVEDWASCNFTAYNSVNQCHSNYDNCLNGCTDQACVNQCRANFESCAGFTSTQWFWCIDDIDYEVPQVEYCPYIQQECEWGNSAVISACNENPDCLNGLSLPTCPSICY